MLFVVDFLKGSFFFSQPRRRAGKQAGGENDEEDDDDGVLDVTALSLSQMKNSFPVCRSCV